MTNVTRILLASVAALALVPAALAAEAPQPGFPCTTEGKTESLSGGLIKCTNGTWQPAASPPPTGGAATGTPPKGNQPSGGKPGPNAGVNTMKAAAIFTKVGTALSQETFASTGRQVADVTGVRLADGRIRLYAFVSPDGIRSAISTDATGTKFTAEPGLRLTFSPGGQTRAYVLDDGRVRLFYTNGGAINSAISSDGLTFTDEGPRITQAQAGFEPGGISIVKFGGGYRAYFSNLEKPGVHADRIARTATSSDMLTWTMGPMITGSSGSIKDGASHPFAITDGKTIALYYNGDRPGFYGALRSTSTDGITFKDERTVLAGAGDPQLIQLPGGATLLYYGWDLGSSGFGIAVARATASPISGVTATAASGASTKATKTPPKKTPPKKPATTTTAKK